MTDDIKVAPDIIGPARNAPGRSVYHCLYQHHKDGDTKRIARCRRHALEMAAESRSAAKALSDYDQSDDPEHLNTAAVHFDYIRHLQLKIEGAA